MLRVVSGPYFVANRNKCEKCNPMYYVKRLADRDAYIVSDDPKEAERMIASLEIADDIDYVRAVEANAESYSYKQEK